MADYEEYASGAEYEKPYYIFGSAAKEQSGITAYPFISISEIYEAGKNYGEKAIEAVKQIVSYPYEMATSLGKETPTATVKTSFDPISMLKNLLKPPWILIILGVFGLWVFGIFKKH